MNKNKNMKIVLASNSPRRKELLAGLDIEFTVDTGNTFEEIYDKYITDGEMSILDAIIVDAEHDEYDDVMEVFGDIRELNIHIYIVSKDKILEVGQNERR